MHTRRSFLQMFLLAAGSAPGRTLPVTWLAWPGAAPELMAGARFGAAEAAATAKLLGAAFAIDYVTVRNVAEASAEARRGRERGSVVLAGGLPGKVASALASAPLLAILPRGEPVQGLNQAWRVRPDPGQYERALAAGRASLPPTERTAARAVAWHATLQRYGAGELNERYLHQTGAPMNEDSWLGWMAVKIALESMLRKRPVGETRIDGHKGVMLRFGEGRSLQQPLYVVVKRGGREVVVDA